MGCLAEHGLLRRESFLVHLHKRRFGDALERHGLASELRLDSVLGMQPLAQQIGTFAGFAAMRRTCEVSKTTGRMANAVLGSISPERVVLGGCGLSVPLQDARQVLSFDEIRGQWEPCPPMLKARHDTCAGVVAAKSTSAVVRHAATLACGRWRPLSASTPSRRLGRRCQR